jgi:arylsulfatase A-like enzyme
MSDILLVTVECVRYDRRHLLGAVDDLQTTEAVAMGAYTRPSLAGLLSGQYAAAAETVPREPTLPATLGDARYATAGFCHSPQCAPALGFADGFETYTHDADSGTRGAWWRERLAEWQPIRRLYRRLQPKEATLEAIPPDEEIVDDAISWWQSTDAPRFCWVHLMGSHRPYGRDEALPTPLGRKAAGATPSALTRALTDAERARVIDHYERSIQNVDEHVARLRAAVNDDTVIAVAGDHGEELGEDGYWFHGPYRRRTAHTLTRVPLATQNIEHDSDMAGLVDIAPTLCESVGVSVPAAWDGAHLDQSRQWLTLAPWAGRCSVAWQTDRRTIRFRNATPESIREAAVDDDTQRQLEALGYR